MGILPPIIKEESNEKAVETGLYRGALIPGDPTDFSQYELDYGSPNLHSRNPVRVIWAILKVAGPFW